MIGRRLSLTLPLLIFVGLLLAAGIYSAAMGTNEEAPYPPSSYISGIEWDWGSHQTRANGSDNWVITWAADDHQYTSWGDGGGFEGRNDLGRVSLGFARVEGDVDDYVGRNVWGGYRGEHPAQYGGKSYGLISVEGALYAWVQPGSGRRNLTSTQMTRSTDAGATWTKSGWSFTLEQGLMMPAIVNFGRDFAGGGDYVYHYFIHPSRTDRGLAVQKPGKLYLARSDKALLMDQNAYEFFSGLDTQNNPTWTESTEPDDRVAVFEDASGVGWNLSVNYNSGLARYILVTEHGESFGSKFGFFESPEPWGPWRTIAYYRNWSAGNIHGSDRAFYGNFSNKWTSSTGLDTVFVFSGVDNYDSWNTVKARFILSAPDASTPGIE